MILLYHCTLIPLYHFLLIIASSLSLLLFLGSMLFILLQKPLSSLFKLTVHGEHMFVFPVLEFIGTLILVTFIIIISLNVILKKHLHKNISFEIVSIVVCALCINTFLGNKTTFKQTQF